MWFKTTFLDHYEIQLEINKRSLKTSIMDNTNCLPIIYFFPFEWLTEPQLDGNVLS